MIINNKNEIAINFTKQQSSLKHENNHQIKKQANSHPPSFINQTQIIIYNKKSSKNGSRQIRLTHDISSHERVPLAGVQQLQTVTVVAPDVWGGCLAELYQTLDVAL